MERGFGLISERTLDTEERIQEFRSSVMRYALELGSCAFCSDEAVMVVNGLAMCQRCGDEERDKRFHEWLLTDAVD